MLSKLAMAVVKNLDPYPVMMEDPDVKEKILSQAISYIDDELEKLCSKKEPSLLRQTTGKDLGTLTSEKVLSEIKERAPSFHRLFDTLCYSKGTRSHIASGKQRKNMMKLVSTATVMMKNRCKSMSAWAAKNTLALQYGGCSNMVIYVFHIKVMILRKLGSPLHKY